MTLNLLVGVATMTLCISIQCLFAGVLLRLMPPFERWLADRPTLVGVWLTLSAVLLVMFAGNVAQVALWAGLFAILGEFAQYPAAFYHSMVNFTTLGYGDVVMSDAHRLLGALEAVNGVLMFGLTTSIVFAATQVLVRRAVSAGVSSGRVGR